MEALASNPAAAPLPPRLRVLVDFAVLLTVEPWGIADEHITRLRAEGLDDRAILDLCQIVAYFNFVNRLADALGVEIEADFEDGGPAP